MSKSKLLFVTRTLYPDTGGSETHVHELACWFNSQGYDVSVLTSPPIILSKYRHPYNVLYADGLREFDACRSGLSTVSNIFNAIRKIKPDIIHVQNIILAIATTLACEAINPRPGIVVADHNTPIPEQRRWLKGLEPFELQLSMARHLYTRCTVDAIVAFSQVFFNWALECQAPQQILHLIHHGVDTNRFRPGQPSQSVAYKLGLVEGTPLVLVPSRVVPRKRHTEIIEALSYPELTTRGARLAILASVTTNDASLLQTIKNQIDSSPARNRISLILDPLEPEEMPDAYRSADCVVLLSEAEGFGLVGIEALASGTPLIGCNCSGLREYLCHEETGLVVPYGSPKQLVQAISRVLDDALLANSLAEKGRKLVESSFSIERQCSELKNIYDIIASQRQVR